MFALKKLATALLLPPTSLVLLALLGLWLSRRHPRSGRWLAATALVVLLALSLPLTGGWLLRGLEQHPPISAAQLAKTDAIVVLGAGIYFDAPEYGGDTLSGPGLERVRYAAYLYRQRPVPILVTGGSPFGGTPEGKVMQQVLQQDLHTPVRWVEGQSNDTADNAAMSAVLLKQAGVRRIVLVSHGWHLPRAIALFEAQGLEVIAAPTLFTRPPPDPLAELLPGSGGFNASRVALHERLGMLANRLKAFFGS